MEARVSWAASTVPSRTSLELRMTATSYSGPMSNSSGGGGGVAAGAVASSMGWEKEKT